MPLTLTPETQRMVEDKLAEGTYQSADQVVQAAIRALNERDFPLLDEETLDAIDEAEAQIDRGEVSEWTELQARIRDMVRSTTPPK